MDVETIPVDNLAKIQGYLDFQSFCVCSAVNVAWRKQFTIPYPGKVQISQLLQLPYDIPLIKETCTKIHSVIYDVKPSEVMGHKVTKWVLGSLKSLTHIEHKSTDLGLFEYHKLSIHMSKLVLANQSCLKNIACVNGISGDDLAGSEFPHVKEFWTHVHTVSFNSDAMKEFIFELHYHFPNLERLVITPKFFSCVLNAFVANGLDDEFAIDTIRKDTKIASLKDASNKDFPDTYDAEVRNVLQKISKTKFAKLPNLEIKILQ